MERMHIVLDKELLRATDEAARRLKRTRSAVVGDAIGEHVRRLRIRELEKRDRQGYSRRAHERRESLAWEAEAAWPPE